MNKNLKISSITLLLALVSSASFGQSSAADLVANFGIETTTLGTTSTAISAVTPSAFTTYTPTGDLAIIDQSLAAGTSGNDAYISQTNSTAAAADSNIASIYQVGSDNKAYIDQSDIGNVALISQTTDGNLGYIVQTSTKSMGAIEQGGLSKALAYITQAGTLQSALIIQQ